MPKDLNASTVPGEGTADERLLALERRLNSQDETIAALNSKVDTLQEENTALQKLVETSGKSAKQVVKLTIPDDTFEVGGRTFKFRVASFTLPAGKGRTQAETVTAKDALTDRDLLEALVARNSGVIKEVV